MKKNKGFTLIELLAVIVILAVIALIATPIIMNVINDSKKGAAKDSAYGYISAATYDLFHEKDGELSYGDYTVNANGNLVKDGKEITVNLKGNKPTGGAITLNSDGRVGAALKFGTYCIVKYLTSDEAYITVDGTKCDASISSNLVKNGYGELGNNTNFSSYQYANDASFAITGGSWDAVTSDEFIAIDPTKKYIISASIKSTSTEAKHYMGIVESDIDHNVIFLHNISSVANTLTTLTQDLKDGDTVVYLNNISNFVNASNTPTHQLGLVFWNYKDSNGYQYPVNTYSRNVWDDLYTYNNVNKSNHTITLKEPWNHGTIKAGTQLSQSHSGMTHNYGLLSNESASTTYQTKYNEMTGERGGWNVEFFRTGVKYIKPFLIHNPGLVANVKTNIKNISIREVNE